MDNPNFEIHKIAKNNEIIEGLLYDYWNFTNFERREYRYTLKQLSHRYDIYYQDLLTNLMKTQGYIEINMLMGCQECRKNFKVFLRKELEALDKKSNNEWDIHFCVECYRKDTVRKINDTIDSINNMLPLGHKEGNFQINGTLSYMEKLLFLTLLDDNEIDPNNIKEHQWNNFIQVEINKSYDIINNLVSKGYIVAHRYDGNIKNQIEQLSLILQESGKYIDKNQESRITFTMDNTNKAFINLPAEHPSCRFFSKCLHNDVISSSVSISDIKQIESYVKNKRQAELLSIFLRTCKEKGIPYKEDNALNMVLSNMAEKFNLKECNNIIEYRSKNVIANIQQASRKGIFRHQTQHYFRAELMRHLDLIDKNPDMKRFEKPLDIDWAISQTETFVSTYIIRDNKFWSGLTVNEIISNWVSSLNVSPD